MRAAAEAGCTVSIVPGPSAPLAAVAVSGLTSGRFVYEGFLPRRGAARAERLAELAASERAVVLLEAPHRCARTAADLAESFGSQRRVVAARELTKLHEEIWRGSLGELAAWAGAGIRGEVVLVIEGAPPPAPPSDADIADALRARAGRRSHRLDSRRHRGGGNPTRRLPPPRLRPGPGIRRRTVRRPAMRPR